MAYTASVLHYEKANFGLSADDVFSDLSRDEDGKADELADG